tara:strand:- start:6649 stop:6993 length:345 start_codon:yes stop_codon:yes gene_type:complete
MENPSLCEPGVKYFIGCSLQESRKFKERYINLFYNIGMTLIFVGGVASFLIYRYKGRKRPEEIVMENRKKQEYIISKLQRLSSIREKNNQNPNMITNLPSWENNPEAEILRKQI